MTEVCVPQFAEGATKIKLLFWVRHPGDWVNAGDTIAEAATTKVSVLIEAPVAGRLTRLLVEEGTEVLVGQALAVIE